MATTVQNLYDSITFRAYPGSISKQGYVVVRKNGMRPVDTDNDAFDDIRTYTFSFLHTSRKEAEKWAETTHGSGWRKGYVIGMVTLSLSCVTLGDGGSVSEDDDLRDVDLSEDLLSDPNDPKIKPELACWHLADGRKAESGTAGALENIRRQRTLNGEKGETLNTYGEYRFY